MKTSTRIHILIYSYKQHQQTISPEKNAEALKGQVNFQIVHSGTHSPAMSVNVSQPFGSSYANPIEVGPIDETKYSGPFDFIAFTEVVEKYIRLQHGEAGGFKLDGVENVIMSDNIFLEYKEFFIDVPN